MPEKPVNCSAISSVPRPWAIIHRMCPELADTSAMSSGIEHRHRRLVAEQPWRSLDRPQLKLIKALEPPCRTLHPAGERRAVEMKALAGKDLHLAVQRQIPGKLRHHHVGHERGRGHAALDQTRQHLRLHHAVGAAAAGVFGTNRAQYPQDRRDHVQHLAHILADPVQNALAARARCRVRLEHLLAARQMLGQRTDVASRFLARLPSRLRRRHIVVGRRRWYDAGCEIVQLQCELLGHDRCQPLRALAEDHLLQRLHRHTQLLVLGVKREHHLGQSRWIGRESIGANRHDQTIHARAPCSSKILTSQPTTAGCFTGLGETRVHSSPSSSIASCVALRCTTPSRIGGQVKCPWCSHFVTSTMPLPSHARSFTLSARLLRNTKTSPQYGFARNASLTSADNVCTDLRKSTGCAASTTLRSGRSAITGCPEAPTAPSKVLPAPRPARPGCAPHPPRSRSPR